MTPTEQAAYWRKQADRDHVSRTNFIVVLAFVLPFALMYLFGL